MVENQFIVFIFGLLSIVCVPFALRNGFFSLSLVTPVTTPKIPFFSPLFAVAVIPLVAVACAKCIAPYVHYTPLQNFMIVQFTALFATLIVLIGLVRIHSAEIQGKIFGTKPIIPAAIKGVFYCLLIYPVVMLGMQVTHLVVDYFYPGQHAEQDAIRLLKKLSDTPRFFWMFAAFACTIVPFVEELLFRGFFQNWLVDRFGKYVGVSVAALLFASAHFSYAQGVTNIELMLGLFTMGCLLGIVYIKQQSLIASVAMHGAFNGLTLLMFAIE